MNKLNINQPKLFVLSFLIMLITDYLMKEEAEYFNLFYFIKYLFGSDVTYYFRYQYILDANTIPFVILALILFHFVTSTILFEIIKSVNRFRS